MSHNQVNRVGGGNGVSNVTASVRPPAISSSPSAKSNKGKPGKIVLGPNFVPKTTEPSVLTISGQQELLRSKCYTDAMAPQTSYFLSTVGYEHAKQYLPSTGQKSVRRAHDLLLFDAEYRSILMKYIGFFEVSFRARYSREMAELRGPFAHRDPSNFKVRDHFDGFLDAYSKELSRSVSSDKRARLAYDKYGYLPIWQAVEIMSFGTLSKLYRNTKSKAVKSNVAKAFGTDYTTLASWLRTITDFRNRCAHFGRISNAKLTSQPMKINGISIVNTNHFYIVLILITLLHEQVNFEDDPRLNHDLLLTRDIAELLTERKNEARDAGIPFNWMALLKKVFKINGVDIVYTYDAPQLGHRKTYISVHGDGNSITGTIG